jgi:triphosphoribosyl-dephospho-CoA synthase
MILLLGRKDCTRRQRDFVAGKERGNTMLLTGIAKSAVSDSTAIDLAELAVWALREEALLTPKPGLVDQRGEGAHSDLTLDLLLISAQAIAPGFCAMAKRAENQTISQHLREDLGRIGRDTEKLMLSATGGVNTHRGAIWALGLLVSAAAMKPANKAPKEVTDGAARLAAITDNFVSALPSHGNQAIHKFGGQGAREQAIAGFPHVINRGLPALIASRAKGACEEDAQLNSLLTIMCDLNDTQIVVAGKLSALDRLGAHVRKIGRARTQLLNTLTPSHCELLSGVQDELTKALSCLPVREPKRLYLSNTETRIVSDANSIRKDLASNVTHPIRWRDGTDLLQECGVKYFIEVLPSDTLSRLVREAHDHLDPIWVAVSEKGFPHALRNLQGN